MDVALETAKEYPLTLKEQQQQQQLLTMKEPPPHPPSKASSILVVEDDAAANNGTNGTNNNTNNTNNNNNNNNNGTNNPVPHNEVELLRRELEKERQSKMALENMIIVSSLNMIGKIEVLEKKHESQLEHLREQLQIYAEKEQETSVLTRNLEDMNMKLRRQVQELEKKLRDGGSGGKEGKEGKESKRKRQVNVVDVEKEGKDYSKDKDLSPHPWGEPSSSAGGGGSSGGSGKLKRSKTDATEKKSKGGKASASSSSYVDSDPLREMVAEALGTIGDIEKGERPPQRPHPRSSSSLQGSTEGTASLHLAHSSVDGTPPSQIKRRKTDPGLNSSQDGTPSSPPLSYSHSSPAISESYTSNYSTFFQYGSSASSAYPASPSSAPQSPASLASSASSVPTHLSNSQNGTSHAHLSSSQSGSYSLSSSRDGNRSSDEYEPVSPSAKRSLVPLFPPASILLPNSPHEKLLSDVHQFQIAQKDRLEKMQQTQKQLIVERKHDPLLVGALESEQMQLRQQIDAEVKAIKQLDKQIVLEPNQLFRLDFLLQDLKIQQKQLELFHNELQAFITAPDPSRCHAALVITKQPFPMVISKFKQLQEEQLVVQLLSGSNVDFHSFSVVKAELICHTKAITKGSTSASNPNASLKKHVDRDTQPLDLSKGVAKFPLKFLTGTRKSCVTLRFVVQVKTASNTVTTVESNASQPFIVITNDCQWEGSEGTLLKNEAFSDQIEIPWAQFVNILQRHFLKATRQSPIQPTRPLSLYDFNYLNTKFFANKPIVSHKSFDNFWGWFGKSLQTVRYKRHISTLWQNGLIFMFLTRERVTQILRNQEPGCFIILFSEAYPGQLEISYVASDKLSASQQNLGLSSSSQGLGTQHMLSLNGSSQGLSLSTSNQSLPTSPTSISTPPPPHHTSSSSSSSSFDPSSPEPPQRHHTPIEPPQPAAHVNPLAASYDGINNSRHLDSNNNNNNNNNNATETKPGPFLSNNNNNNNNTTSPEQNNTNASTSPSDSNANNNNNNNLSTSGANVNTAATTPTTPTSSSSSGLTIIPPSTPTLTVASAPITPTSAPITPTPSTPSSGNALSVSASSTPLASQLTHSVHGNKIKHYLVQANDTAGSKRTLPDFLNECPQFTHILQLNVATLNTSTDWATVGVPSFKKQPKDQVLEPFYSKRGATSPGFIANGYDPL